MRLEDGRREQSRRSSSDWHFLLVTLLAIGIVAGVLLYFSTPLADTLSRHLMRM
jgi:hypothetical protein